MTIFEKAARLPRKHPARFTGAVLFLVVVITWLIYAGTTRYEYLDWDDNTLVEQNPWVTQPTKERIRDTFVPHRVPGPHLPLRSLSYVFDLSVLGKDAPAYCPDRTIGNRPVFPCQTRVKPHYHHIVNIWLYALNGILLFFVLRRLLDPWAAAIGTLIWIAHPVHVEAVSWVSGRKEMLSGAFILGGFLAYMAASQRQKRPPSGRGALVGVALVGITTLLFFLWRDGGVWPVILKPGGFRQVPFVFGIISLALLMVSTAYAAWTTGSERRLSAAGLHAGAVLLTLGAMLSKPVAIVIPPILLAWEIGYRPHRETATGVALLPWSWVPRTDELRATAARWLPHTAVIVWGMWITMGRGQASAVVKNNATWNAAPDSQFIGAMHAIWLDVYHLVAPLNLSALYDVKSDHWYWQAIAGLALLIAMPVLAIWLLMKSPKALLWLAFFVAPIAPVSGIIALASLHNDRYLYLPAVALAVALGVLLATAAFGSDEETGIWERWLSAGLTVVIVGGFGVLSYQRTAIWSQDRTLWRDAVKNNPELPSARNNYGAALMNAGIPTRPCESTKCIDGGALEQYYKAYELLPTLDVAQFNIAATEFKLGRPEKAMKYVEEFVAQHPEMPTGFILAGQIYMAQHRKMLQAGINPDEADARARQAEDAYRKACEVPTPDWAALQLYDKGSACNQLGIVLTARNEIEAAEQAFFKAIETVPEGDPRGMHRQFRQNLARFYRQQKRDQDALRQLDEVSRMLGGAADVETARLYTQIYLDMGQPQRAKDYSDLLLRNPRGVPPQDRQLAERVNAALRSGPLSAGDGATPR